MASKRLMKELADRRVGGVKGKKRDGGREEINLPLPLASSTRVNDISP